MATSKSFKQYSRALTLQPLLVPSHSAAHLRSYQPSESLSPASPVPFSYIIEAESLLRGKVRKINLRLGRDAEACLRPLSLEMGGHSHREKPRIEGFKRVEQRSSEPVLTYLKTISKGYNSERRLNPPLMHTSRRTEGRKSSLIPLSLSERTALQAELQHKMQMCRTELHAKVAKAMDKANKMHIFPKAVNEARGKSMIEVGEMEELAVKMRKFYRRKVKEIVNRREQEGEMMITAVKEEAEDQKQAFLEGKLVDKVAWADRKAYESRANQPRTLTSEEIDAKVKKMNAESRRKLPELRRVRNFPDASMV